jgi:hypothetical protein
MLTTPVPACAKDGGPTIINVTHAAAELTLDAQTPLRGYETQTALFGAAGIAGWPRFDRRTERDEHFLTITVGASLALRHCRWFVRKGESPNTHSPRRPRRDCRSKRAPMSKRDLPDHPMARLYLISSHRYGVGNENAKGNCHQFGDPVNSAPYCARCGKRWTSGRRWTSRRCRAAFPRLSRSYIMCVSRALKGNCG